jgi:hypothetical protein
MISDPVFLAILALLSSVFADAAIVKGIPDLPPVYDPSFPNGTRCYDFCVLLGSPNALCPGHPDDINCLCNVYNVRLPAVFS